MNIEKLKEQINKENKLYIKQLWFYIENKNFPIGKLIIFTLWEENVIIDKAS